jgi:hypothetical protein
MTRLSQDCALVVPSGLESVGPGETARLEIGGTLSSSYPPDGGLPPPSGPAGSGAPEIALSSHSSGAPALPNRSSLHDGLRLAPPEGAGACASGVEGLTSRSNPDGEGQRLPEPLPGQARRDDRGRVPMLPAPRVDGCALNRKAALGLLRVESGAGRAHRCLPGAGLADPAGALSRRAIGAWSEGKALSTGCPDAVLFYELFQP